MKKVVMLVCCHKEDIWKEDEVYLPLHVGKSQSNIDLGIQCDNEGENISYKNGSYCELTGLYWAWKNLKDVEYIGLCHYRRYFNFYKKGDLFSDYSIIDKNEFDNIDLSLPNLDSIFQKSNIILPEPKIYGFPLYVQYGVFHYLEDLEAVRDIIINLDPSYEEAVNKILYHTNEISCYNMFIMKWSDFDKYCQWLFPILEAAENLIDIASYDSGQKRIWGFLSERLLNIYVYKNRMNVKHYPVYFIQEESKKKDFIFRLKREMKHRVGSLFSYVVPDLYHRQILEKRRIKKDF